MAGLQITAGQRTMSGQILRWPDNLPGRLRWYGKKIRVSIFKYLKVQYYYYYYYRCLSGQKWNMSDQK